MTVQCLGDSRPHWFDIATNSLARRAAWRRRQSRSQRRRSPRGRRNARRSASRHSPGVFDSNDFVIGSVDVQRVASRQRRTDLTHFVSGGRWRDRGSNGLNGPILRMTFRQEARDHRRLAVDGNFVDGFDASALSPTPSSFSIACRRAALASEALPSFAVTRA